MLSFAPEEWKYVKEEAKELWPAHFAEVGMGRHSGWPLDPDLAHYDALAAQGSLSIVIGRHKGKIMAYHAAIIDTLKHYTGVLAAYGDLYWIDKRHRSGANALGLFCLVEVEARRRGAKVLIDVHKVEKDLARLFLRLDYVPMEHRYMKFLED
jgi:hypothetical protein